MNNISLINCQHIATLKSISSSKILPSTYFYLFFFIHFNVSLQASALVSTFLLQLTKCNSKFFLVHIPNYLLHVKSNIFQCIINFISLFPVIALVSPFFFKSPPIILSIVLGISHVKHAFLLLLYCFC